MQHVITSCPFVNKVSKRTRKASEKVNPQLINVTLTRSEIAGLIDAICDDPKTSHVRALNSAYLKLLILS